MKYLFCTFWQNHRTQQFSLMTTFSISCSQCGILFPFLIMLPIYPHLYHPLVKVFFFLVLTHGSWTDNMSGLLFISVCIHPDLSVCSQCRSVQHQSRESLMWKQLWIILLLESKAARPTLQTPQSQNATESVLRILHYVYISIAQASQINILHCSSSQLERWS